MKTYIITIQRECSERANPNRYRAVVVAVADDEVQAAAIAVEITPRAVKIIKAVEVEAYSAIAIRL